MKATPRRLDETRRSADQRAYAAAAAVLEACFAARADGNAAALAGLLHPVFSAKRAAPDHGIEVETRSEFVSRVCTRSDGSIPHLTSLQMCFGDFAIARSDDWSRALGRIHLLFKEEGLWRIVGEAWASAEDGVRDARFTPRCEEAAVLEVLGAYYRAVTEGDPDVLESIFDPCWEMKNHENERIVSEDKATFIERIRPGPTPGYWDDRQIGDVQIIAGRLAYVRVDRPSTPSTTIFLFMKIGGAWRVIDKAWTDGRKVSSKQT